MVNRVTAYYYVTSSFYTHDDKINTRPRIKRIFISDSKINIVKKKTIKQNFKSKLKTTVHVSKNFWYLKFFNYFIFLQI